jgi:hypothetical protein
LDTARITGAVALVAILLAAMLLGAPLAIFHNTPSLLLVVLGGAAAWSSMCGRGVPAMFRTLRDDRATASDLAAALETIRTGRRAFWMTGWAGLFIGWGQMVYGLDDWSAFGPAMAVSLLTVLYALLTNLFALSPIESRLAARQAATFDGDGSPRQLDRELAASRQAMDALRRRVQSPTQRTR